MDIIISKEKVRFLKEIPRIPISFQVDSVFDLVVNSNNFITIELVERRITEPYIKDYDSNKVERPFSWGNKWDVSNWGIFKVIVDFKLIGSAVVAWNTKGVNMLNNRDDIIALWDIRVDPEYRNRGVGNQLFKTVVNFGKEKNCILLKIETQNINVKACKFYKKQGCYLGAFDMHAYSDYPEEVMLIWYYDL